MLFGMKPRSIESIIDERIYEAQREYLDNAAAAARVQALANVYKQRVDWLRAERESLQGQPKGPEGLPEPTMPAPPMPSVLPMRSR